MNKKNQKIRRILDTMIESMQPGDIIKIERILPELVARNRSWGITSLQIGNLCREREDLRRVVRGTWEKIPLIHEPAAVLPR